VAAFVLRFVPFGLYPPAFAVVGIKLDLRQLIVFFKCDKNWEA